MRAVLLSTFLAVLVALISISLAMPQQILAAAPNTTNFSENHQLYDTGADIAALQQFLNTHGFLVALSGPGAPGEETGFFGILTYQALIKFQAAHGLPATGFFGPLTRALLNGSDTTQTAPTTSTLTQTQISAILSLLQSFGADQATVNNVQAALGTPGTTHATTTAAAPPIYTTPPPTPAIGQPWHAPSGGGGGGAPDTTAPVITLSGNNPLTVAQGGTFTDPGATATDNSDGTDSVSVSGSVDTSTLGTYTLTYSATDKAGNTATASRTVNVTDQTPPVISSISSGTPGQTSATVTWTTNEPATSIVNYGTVVSYGSASSSAALVTSHSITLTGLTASTTYDFQIQSADAAGNVATSSNQTFTTTIILAADADTYYNGGPYVTSFDPWGKGSLVNGVDYTQTMQVTPSIFPNNTLMSWNWPSGGCSGGGVCAYPHIGYVNNPPTSIGPTPIQISALNNDSLSFNYSVSGSGVYNVLDDEWLSSSASATWPASYEITLFPNILSEPTWARPNNLPMNHHMTSPFSADVWYSPGSPPIIEVVPTSTFTNQFSNSTLSGAVNGTPGTDPTGCDFTSGIYGSADGITKTIVGHGSTTAPDGATIDYVDVQLSGTPTATGPWVLSFSPVWFQGDIATVYPQRWWLQPYLAMTAGSVTRVWTHNLIQ